MIQKKGHWEKSRGAKDRSFPLGAHERGKEKKEGLEGIPKKKKKKKGRGGNLKTAASTGLKKPKDLSTISQDRG